MLHRSDYFITFFFTWLFQLLAVNNFYYVQKNKVKVIKLQKIMKGSEFFTILYNFYYAQKNKVKLIKFQKIMKGSEFFIAAITVPYCS